MDTPHQEHKATLNMPGEQQEGGIQPEPILRTPVQIPRQAKKTSEGSELPPVSATPAYLKEQSTLEQIGSPRSHEEEGEEQREDHHPREGMREQKRKQVWPGEQET